MSNPAYKRNLTQLTENLRSDAYVRRWFDQIGFECADLIEELQREAIGLAQRVEELEFELAVERKNSGRMVVHYDH